MNKIIEWLKRITNLQFITLVLSIITTFFAYNQYIKDNSGSVTPCINNIEVQEVNKSFIICKTEDTIKIANPEIVHTFRNTSKYTIQNFHVNYTLLFPNTQMNEKISFDTSPKFTKPQGSLDVNQNVYKWNIIYKENTFFPGEITPTALRKLIISPLETTDTLFYYFDIITNVGWDGKEDKTYSSRIWFYQVKDTFCLTDSISQEMFIKHHQNWAATVQVRTKGKLDNNGVDFILAYHSRLDSLNEFGQRIAPLGFWSHFHSINNENIDSITSSVFPSPHFYYSHKYVNYVRENIYSTNWWSLVVGIMGILITIFFTFICRKSFLQNPIKYNIFWISAILSFLIISFRAVYIELYNNHFIDESFDIFYWWIIIPIGLISTLTIAVYLLLLIIKYLRNINIKTLKWLEWWFVPLNGIYVIYYIFNYLKYIGTELYHHFFN